MKNLKFVGPQHYREITEADWRSAGVEDQTAITVAGENAFVRSNDYKTPQVVKLSDDAAAFLLHTEGDLWEETDAEAGVAPIKTRAAEATKLREAAVAKGEEEGDLHPQVPDGTVKEIEKWVGDDKDRAQAALDVENDRSEPRSTLISTLEDIVGDDDEDEGDEDDDEETEDDD